MLGQNGSHGSSIGANLLSVRLECRIRRLFERNGNARNGLEGLA